MKYLRNEDFNRLSISKIALKVSLNLTRAWVESIWGIVFHMNPVLINQKIAIVADPHRRCDRHPSNKEPHV